MPTEESIKELRSDVCCFLVNRHNKGYKSARKIADEMSEDQLNEFLLQELSDESFDEYTEDDYVRDLRSLALDILDFEFSDEPEIARDIVEKMTRSELEKFLCIE